MRNLKFPRLSSGGNLDIIQASRAVSYFIHFLGKAKPYLLFLYTKSFCLRVHFLHMNLPEVIGLDQPLFHLIFTPNKPHMQVRCNCHYSSFLVYFTERRIIYV